MSFGSAVTHLPSSQPLTVHSWRSSQSSLLRMHWQLRRQGTHFTGTVQLSSQGSPSSVIVIVISSVPTSVHV